MNRVVPLAVKRVGRQVNERELLVGDAAARLVFLQIVDPVRRGFPGRANEVMHAAVLEIALAALLRRPRSSKRLLSTGFVETQENPRCRRLVSKPSVTA